MRVSRVLAPTYLFLFSSLLVGQPDFALRCQTVDQKAKKKSITVGDAIEMVQWANSQYIAGGSADDKVAQFSPDGERFVVVLRKGNVGQNTNEYSVLLFHTKDVFRSPQGERVLTMTSASNDPAIGDIQWLPDSQTIEFLGQGKAESNLIYTLNVATKHLSRLVQHSTKIKNYVISRTGDEIVFTAERPKHVETEEERRDGVVVSSQGVIQLLLGETSLPSRWDSDLFVQRRGRNPAPIPIENLMLYRSEDISLSPDGRFALVHGGVRNVPEDWFAYQDKDLQTLVRVRPVSGQLFPFPRWMLLDIENRRATPLLDTPITAQSRTVTWAPDSKSVFLKSYLPLSDLDSFDRGTTAKTELPVEVKVPSREVFRLTEEQYTRETAKAPKTGSPLQVTLEEDLNSSAKIYAMDPKTKQKALLLDLNPQFAALNFGRVQTIEWKVKNIPFKGGLYLPPDYEPGRRYPLVIQTHGFTPSRFSMDGCSEWSSGYAARPLAAQGIVVLQAFDFVQPGEHDHYNDDLSFGANALQAGRNVTVLVWKAAIDYLDEQGIIDRTRVGISGFSRTVDQVAFMLTHPDPKYRLAAAVLTDGIDGGYYQYITFPTIAREIDPEMGDAAPFGDGLKEWMKQSPSFNMSQVSTPLRVVALNSYSVLEMWEWYSALTLQRKAVDFIEIPDGTHLLQKPWERRTAMQGLVDWFRYWLKGEEDDLPAKAAQYARWGQMRKLQGATATGVEGVASN